MQDPSGTNQKIFEDNDLKQKIKELAQAELDRKRAEEALRES